MMPNLKKSVVLHFVGLCIVLSLVSHATADTPQKTQCLELLDKLHGALIGRRVQVESSFDMGSIKGNLRWDEFVQQIPLSRSDGSIQSLQFWGIAHDYEQRHPPKGPAELVYRGIGLNGRTLGIQPRNGEIRSLVLMEQIFDFGDAGPFVGVFHGSSRFNSPPRFSEWSRLSSWRTRRSDGQLVMVARLPDETVELAFVGADAPRLVRVKLDGKAMVMEDGQEVAIPVYYNDEYRFAYENISSLSGKPDFVPSGYDATKLWKKNENSTIVILSSRLTDVGASTVVFETYGDVVHDVPNGTRVQVNDHPGIKFEWRDGEIVRMIDRKRVDELAGYSFTGSKWKLPIVVISLGALIWFAWAFFRAKSSAA